jgi:hypothetical protein
MIFKKLILVILSVTSSFGWAQPTSQPQVIRPGEPRPGPSPRPSPRPEPRPSPRPEPRPSPRPEPRPSPRPEPRPSPRPEPRPSPRPEPRPSPRPEPRPSPRPEPRPSPRPEPRPSPRPEPRPSPRPEPRPSPRPEPRPSPRPEPRPSPRPPRPPVRPEPRPPRPNPRPRPRPPGPIRPHPRPYPPRPIRPIPPRPLPPIVNPNPGQYFSQVVNLNYTVSNQYLDLMQMLNLYRYNSDYTVESVVVRTNGFDNTGSVLRLWVNNQVEDEVTWPSGTVSLYPRFDLRLGVEMQNLFLQVDGSTFISQIEVRIRRVGYAGDYYQFRVPIEIDQDLYENDIVRINDWADLNQYQGYRLISLEVDADAYYEAEKLSLLIDETDSGEVYVIGENSTVSLFPTSSVVLGANAHEISLLASGGGALSLNQVTLRLSKY